MYLICNRGSSLAASMKASIVGSRRLFFRRRPRRGYLDWNQDLFLSFPADPRIAIRNMPGMYANMLGFFRANKFGQWKRLDQYFDTPQLGDPPFVVRPLRHSGGRDFEVVDELPAPERAATHYWRSLWKRNREYRLIYCHGKLVLTLLKRVNEGTPQNVAWNHGVSRFVTVTDPANDRMKNTTFFEDVQPFLRDHPFHFIAFDILYRKGTYAVVEVNFSPGITIPENQTKISNALRRSEGVHVAPVPAS
jgi:hypothetical protein